MAERLNTFEGLRRLAMVLRWAGYLGGFLLALFAVFSATEVNDSVMLVLLLPAAAVMTAGWALSWVVEGFIKSEV